MAKIGTNSDGTSQLLSVPPHCVWEFRWKDKVPASFCSDKHDLLQQGVSWEDLLMVIKRSLY